MSSKLTQEEKDFVNRAAAFYGPSFWETTDVAYRFLGRLFGEAYDPVSGVSWEIFPMIGFEGRWILDPLGLFQPPED